jgi:acyl-CoA hydrolase
LLALALEAGYATAYRAAGEAANLVLKRVLDVRCFEPVPVGHVIEIRGCEVVRARAHVVVGLIGTPLAARSTPWMDGLMQFVQIDEMGRPEPLEGEPSDDPITLPPPWDDLRDRAQRLLTVRT